MKKQNLNSKLKLSKKVISNLQSDAVKGGSGFPFGHTLQCAPTEGACEIAHTNVHWGCTKK